LGLAAEFSEGEGVLKDGNKLIRGDKGEGDYDAALEFELDGERISYDVTVQAREFDDDEAEALLEAAKEEIEEEFCGTSPSVNEISNDVVIRDSYQEGAVEAEWCFEDSTLMNSDGSIASDRIPESGIVTYAWVDLYCGGKALSDRIDFRLVPGELSRGQKAVLMIDESIEGQMASDNETVILPEYVGDTHITWSTKKTYTALKIFALSIIVAVLLPFVKKSRMREAEKQRQEKLATEYPDLVGKLAILISAGMTVQGAWKRIALSYESRRKKYKTARLPAYEEMLVTCRELESGVAEERVYDRFGERCRQAKYRRLGNLLTQNLKKGSRGLSTLLEKEVDDAYTDRKNMAKKLGEEASTKLLAPMMMMLAIVLLILIYPAIVSFYM
jgi:hypothetical protein